MCVRGVHPQVHGWVHQLLASLASLYQQMRALACEESDPLIEGVVFRLMVAWQACTMEELHPTLSLAGAARMRADLGFFRSIANRFVTEATVGCCVHE